MRTPQLRLTSAPAVTARRAASEAGMRPMVGGVTAQGRRSNVLDEKMQISPQWHESMCARSHRFGHLEP